MRARTVIVVAAAAVLAVLAAPGATSGRLNAASNSAAALTGKVSSQEEGAMEGVLVIARGEGANFTTTVVSNAKGQYSFPRSHMTPGQYDLTVRATGYEVTAPSKVTVKAGDATAFDLKIQKSKDLTVGRSSLEWALSVPGTEEQHDMFFKKSSCNYCHSYKRILSSKYTAEQFVGVIRRMGSYFPDGSAISDDGRGKGAPKGIGDSGGKPASPPRAGQSDAPSNNWRGIPLTELGGYLASVNLSGGKTTWDYELKALPRPTGAATRVIVTQWDMPRRNTVSHDMTIDSKGVVWYADEAAQTLGKLEPKTNTFTEYPMPALPQGHLPGTRDIEVDRADNIWVSVRVPGGASLLSKFEPATQKLTTVEGAYGQFIAIGADGTPWINVPGSSAGDVVFRVNPKTMAVDKTFQFKDAPIKPAPGPYQMVVNSKGNPYVTSLYASYIVGFDAATGTPKYWSMPGAGPRRGRMDDQDRFWFAEYFGDKLGMLDTRSEQFKEWPLPRKNTNPYTASVPDKQGRVYVSSNMSERLLRVDTKTGEAVEYLMPTNFDTKKIVYDPTTASRPTLWMANTRNARLVRVEPLD